MEAVRTAVEVRQVSGANEPLTGADAALSNDRNLLRPVLPVARQPEKLTLPGTKRGFLGRSARPLAGERSNVMGRSLRQR
jgi:hypothetical protein